MVTIPQVLNRFLDMLERSIVVQAGITVGIIATVLTLIVQGKSIPAELSSMMWLVFGFYFGSKVENAKAYIASKLIDLDVLSSARNENKEG